MACGLFIKTEGCVGCHACEVACKQEHNLPVGPKRIRIYDDGPQQIAGRLQLRYKAAVCQQCAKPACRDACPTGAISQRADGITVIDEALCNGCKSCLEACPYGAMQFDDVKKVASKCDLCVERLDKGLTPACVNACPSHCIHFGTAQTAGV